MHVRHPVWVTRAARPGATVFAVLFTLESLARATLVTVIPLQAFELFGSARNVSILATLVGVSGLVGSFSIPFLIRWLRRRWVYTLGAVLLAGAALLLATATQAGQASAMLLRTFGTACLNIALSLYIMDYIAKRDLVRSEPRRMMFCAFAWTVGPALGVWLHERVGHGAPEILSAGCALVLLGVFWWLRIADNPAVGAASRPPPDPLRAIRRFVAQPRLRLGWTIPFGRSSWWSMFFTYAPLYMVVHGAPPLAGALVASAGNAVLFLAPLGGRLGRRFGLRRVIAGGFVVLGASTLAAGLIDGAWITGGLLVAGALGAAALDAVGGIPFMRSVHAYERPAMTTVYRTYVDVSELLPSALFALLLVLFPLKAVFIATGLAMFGFAAVALRHVPRGL